MSALLTVAVSVRAVAQGEQLGGCGVARRARENSRDHVAGKIAKLSAESADQRFRVLGGVRQGGVGRKPGEAANANYGGRHIDLT
jgi:hypothetical protein